MDNYNTVQEFKELPMATDACTECGGKRELEFRDYQIKIEGYEIAFKEIPQLVCEKCKHTILSDRSKLLVYFAFRESKKKNITRNTFFPREFSKRYEFCEEYDFNYDHRDYDNIPGLSAMTDDGFLTPVFFDKKSLVYFMHNPDYTFSLGSETYGTFNYLGKFIIAFGINKNDKVIMWLGDLDSLNEETLQYLKIHNVPSDHTLMNTEFYDAQLNCKWGSPILEREIINLRNAFYDNLKTKHSLDLHHLDNEVIERGSSIKKPLMYNADEIRPNFSALHQILIEAINISELKKYYEENVEPLNRDKNYKNWKSIKYYEFLLTTLTDEKDIRTVISPLYLLNDLRNIYSHLMPNEKVEDTKKNILKTLELEEFDLKEVYNRVLSRLRTLFIVLNKGKKTESI